MRAITSLCVIHACGNALRVFKILQNYEYNESYSTPRSGH